MDKRIACIVVTYNRKELLFNCIQHICNQSYRPETIYVIDNASTDGTLEMADKMKKIAQGLNFKYVRLEKNLGGAGGFYTGLKMAHESGKFDAYWVMDDDGIPEKNCLKQLLCSIILSMIFCLQWFFLLMITVSWLLIIMGDLNQMN